MDSDRCTQFAIECDADIFPIAITSILKVLMSLRYIVTSLVSFQFNFPTSDAVSTCFVITSWFKIELVLIPFVLYHIAVENISFDCLQCYSVKENVSALIIIFCNSIQMNLTQLILSSNKHVFHSLHALSTRVNV